jgi:hypothetical protein
VITISYTPKTPSPSFLLLLKNQIYLSEKQKFRSAMFSLPAGTEETPMAVMPTEVHPAKAGKKKAEEPKDINDYIKNFRDAIKEDFGFGLVFLPQIITYLY